MVLNSFALIAWMCQRIYLSSFQEKSQSSLQVVNESEELKCNVSVCESLIKKKEETEEIVKKRIENQMKSFKSLKKNHNVSPSYHTLEYVEEIFHDGLIRSRKRLQKRWKTNKSNRRKTTGKPLNRIKTTRLPSERQEFKKRWNLKIVRKGQL